MLTREDMVARRWLGRNAISAAVIAISFGAGMLAARTWQATPEVPGADIQHRVDHAPQRGRSSVSSPIGKRTHQPDSTFAVPTSKLDEIKFDRFDENLRVTDEARAILRISESNATQIQSIAQEFLPEYHASEARRFRPATNPRFAYEIAPATDGEAAAMTAEFTAAVARVVGLDTAVQLPFPIEINTGNHYQIFNVAKADGSRDMAIEVARVRQVGNRIFSYSAFDDFRLNDGAPVPERWQHVLTQEDFALKAISK